MIATGGYPIVPDIPGCGLPGVMVLKNLDHGRRIKAYLAENRVRKAVIVGMGYIALEMCEAFRARGIQVDMIKPRPVFLPWLEAELAETVRTEVQANGVNLYPGHDVQRIETINGGLRVVSSDFALDADMVLFAIGITPNSELAEKAGIKTGAGSAIAVDRCLRTSDPHVYAAGDCADAYHVVTGRKTWVPLALRANRAGWAVADNICGKKTELRGICGTAVFKVFGLEVARSGLNLKEAAEAGFRPASVNISARNRYDSRGRRLCIPRRIPAESDARKRGD